MQQPQGNSSGGAGVFAAAVLFCFVLAFIIVGTLSLTGKAGEEGVLATRHAIERAAVLCYATEGFYPPGLTYLEENYGIQIDRRLYSVTYEVFSPGITPNIVVVAR